MKKELLAPAGDIEAGYAALYYGADAVYLGLRQFSARATAANFDEQALNEFTAYAHSLGRKVYAAVNTLVQEDELDDLLRTLDMCAKYGVDAVIIQDMGVAEIIREHYPELEMHASTQMAVHNKEGALALQKMGFSRVVLARELSLPEIREIAAIPGLETEAFIHGALCYSYSGVCLFSSLETGKSANRGKCLYPCRAAFHGSCGEKHYFSMKDMALQEDVLKMPVTSLKIEGRKKTALYVAAVTDYYRRILDGKGADEKRAENIRQIFSRPWTKFHFNGKNKDVIDRDFVGHRGLKIGQISRLEKGCFFIKTNHKIARYDGIQIDVAGEEKPFGFSLQMLRVNGKNVFEAKPGETAEIRLPAGALGLECGWSVYLASSSEVKGAYPFAKPRPGEYKRRDEIEVILKVSAGEIAASAAGKTAALTGTFMPAKDAAKTESAVKAAFGKTGDTELALKAVIIDNPDGRFVPVSMLNELRRKLYSQIETMSKQGQMTPVKARKLPEKAQWLIKTDQPECLSQTDLSRVAEVVVLLDRETDIEKIAALPKNKVRLALPTVCRHPQIFEKQIKTLLGMGYKKWEIGNYWGLSVLPEKGIDLSFDASLYVMNTQAVRMAEACGAGRVCAALEDDLKNIRELSLSSPLPVCMVVYQDVPLFTSADCIRDNACKDCSRGEKWLELSRGGVKYKALSKDCQIMLFDERPLCLAAEAGSVPADYYRADFCHKKYSPEEVKNIFAKLQAFEDAEDCRKGNAARPSLL